MFLLIPLYSMLAASPLTTRGSCPWLTEGMALRPVALWPICSGPLTAEPLRYVLLWCMHGNLLDRNLAPKYVDRNLLTPSVSCPWRIGAMAVNPLALWPTCSGPLTAEPSRYDLGPVLVHP